jgi:hypothetical protein
MSFLALFSGLLAAIVLFQAYRGVVAFRHPERELPRRGRTPWYLWVLLVLVLLVVALGGLLIGARVFH